ncbi:MAG: hypothetical protein HY908_25460 [Myxococcales bacterium]|nr:hypothetical protein [Myxococcales bacterium]
MNRIGLAALGVLAVTCDSGAPSAPPPPSPAAASAIVSAPQPPAPVASAAPIVCPVRRPIGRLALARDGRLATACTGRECSETFDRFVDIWDLAHGRFERSLPIGAVQLSPIWRTDAWLAVLEYAPPSGVSRFMLWDTHQWAAALDTPFYCIADLDFDPGATRAVLLGCDGAMLGFDLAARTRVDRPVAEAHAGGDYFGTVSFVEGGNALLVADEMNGIQVLDPTTLRRRRQAAQERRTDGWVLSPSRRLVAVGSADGALDVYRVPELELVRRVFGPSEPQAALFVRFWFDWLDETRLVVSHAERDSVTVWAVDRSTAPMTLRAPGGSRPEQPCVPAAALDPRATRIAVTLADCSIAVYEAVTLTRVWHVVLPADVAGVARGPTVSWAPDAQHLALIGRDRRLLVLDVHGRPVYSAATRGFDDALVWSSDGRVLLAALDELTLVRLADRATLTLALFAGERSRTGVAVTSRAIAGSPALDPCTRGAVEWTPRKPVPSLLADFWAGEAIEPP